MSQHHFSDNPYLPPVHPEPEPIVKAELVRPKPPELKSLKRAFRIAVVIAVAWIIISIVIAVFGFPLWNDLMNRY